jgi:hypothetical protein
VWERSLYHSAVSYIYGGGAMTQYERQLGFLRRGVVTSCTRVLDERLSHCTHTSKAARLARSGVSACPTES